ncbi:hypothetical protein [Hyphomicrobium sp.]|uniref:hypothetical protein n=1 Tax=Hyphomicrobium sp. TaxID=82 RepID=UPI002E346288|nr:hypothetical protein [Hyphomicrobium sp.]HEX2839950.1 hypothetical protein [Hyphomicrobium sp.]
MATNKRAYPDPRDDVLRDRFETFRREREQREKNAPKRDREDNERSVEQDRGGPRRER